MPGDGAVHYNHSQFSQAGCNHSQFGQSCCGTWPPRAALARAQRRENKPSRGAQADLTPKLPTVRRLSPRSRTGPTPEQELCPPRSFCSAPGVLVRSRSGARRAAVGSSKLAVGTGSPRTPQRRGTRGTPSPGEQSLGHASVPSGFHPQGCKSASARQGCKSGWRVACWRIFSFLNLPLVLSSSFVLVTSWPQSDSDVGCLCL